MSSTLNLGNGNWAVKEDSLLGYNNENENYKPLPFDFTRASSATVVNKVGLIETVQSGIPRIDFSDDVNGALLSEPQRTNVVYYSELLNTYFTTQSAGTVITDNYGIAPNGLQSSSRIQFGAVDYCLRGLSLSTNSTSSVYVKGIIGETIQFGVGGNVAQGGLFTFNGSWQRIEYLYQGGSGSILFSNLQAAATATDFEVFGLQVENNATYATSYIPTSGTTVTRVAETCNGGGNDQVINSTEGVLYYESSALSNDIGSTRVLSISNGSSSNTLYTGYNATSNVVQSQLVVGGVAQTNMSYTVIDRTNFIKVAILYQNNNHKMFINGAEVAVDTSGSVPSANTFDRLNFDLGQGSFDFYGNIKDIRVYPTALSDAELTTLTTL